MSYYQRSLCPLRAQAPQPLLYDCSLIKKSQHDPVLIEYLEKEVEDTLVYEVVESAWGIILDLVRLTPQSRQHSKYLAPAKLGLLVFAKEIVAKSNVDTRVLASTLILLGRLEQKLLLNPRSM